VSRRAPTSGPARAPALPFIRAMRPADLTQVLAIESATAPVPWSRAMMAAELDRIDGISLVAARGRDVDGYVFVALYAEIWHILNVCVREQQRNRGLGRRLMSEVFVRGDERAHLGYTLEVRVSNWAAIHLYESLGFADQGVRPGYYSDNKEDARIMWRAGPTEHAA
jgi:[ribosomal protein S18]-alanine N-acetyltransferase